MSGSGNEAGEKTFAPTAKRLRDAARKGDVLRSRELATAASILVGAGWLVLAGPWLLQSLMQAMRAGMQWDRAALEDFTPATSLLTLAGLVLPPVIALGLAVIAASLGSQLGFGEGRWMAGNLAPKGSRLNPLSGLKRMFGLTGLIEIAKGFAKVGLLGAIAWGWVRLQAGEIVRLGDAPLGAQLAFGWRTMIALLFALGGGLVVIALIDVPVQWLRRTMRLKMSQQELRDEHKEAEGAPEARAARRERQRQIAMGGVAHAMRQAQFVVTNPTHFAVALAYDPDRAPAPLVLAKGRGDKALAMRELAAELDVPCLEYPELARSLFYTTRERTMIREELYGAVAALLAFVLSLRRGERNLAPLVNVPVTVRFDAEGHRAGA